MTSRRCAPVPPDDEDYENFGSFLIIEHANVVSAFIHII